MRFRFGFRFGIDNVVGELSNLMGNRSLVQSAFGAPARQPTTSIHPFPNASAPRRGAKKHTPHCHALSADAALPGDRSPQFKAAKLWRSDPERFF
jgi:hypothetical protein